MDRVWLGGDRGLFHPRPGHPLRNRLRRWSGRAQDLRSEERTVTNSSFWLADVVPA